MWYSNQKKKFSTYPPSTLINLSQLYQRVETRSMEVFWLLSQPLPRPRFNFFVITETFAMFLDPAVNRFTRQTLPTVNTKHFFMNTLYINPFTPQARSPFWSPKPATEHAHARLLPRLSWSWAVLLPSDTQKTYYVHYNCFTSICDLFIDSFLHFSHQSSYHRKPTRKRVQLTVKFKGRVI
jgi:hypothetical protein